ncbi:hypothetical protein DCC81_12785 [Chitinophaga parva]|uniref:Uncharacterized protein n=1 Tax=Chitinophaga parva TaxID=2169414 RepID=A0A2T7BFW5_9BACT|nr:hypothetical protein [Chitinophaga parva]PUZ25178.1 hypothetical protein DCC81_12785 [Chitinophaga parva]
MKFLRSISNGFYTGLLITTVVLLVSSCKKDELTARKEVTVMQVVPLSDTLPAIVTQPTLLTGTHPWFIKGWLYVTNDASLAIEPGAEIYTLPPAQGGGSGIIVTRGSKLVARGTGRFPVNFYLGGKGGGIILLGNAPAGKKDIYDKANWVAGQKLSYGGTYPADSTGALEHVRIVYRKDDNVNNFPGGLLLLGVGSKTRITEVTLELHDVHAGVDTGRLK